MSRQSGFEHLQQHANFELAVLLVHRFTMMKVTALFCMIACASAIFNGGVGANEASAHTSSSLVRQSISGQSATDSGTCVFDALTCSLPKHTTYAHAFTLASALQSCDDSDFSPIKKNSWVVAATDTTCYDARLCRFCFKHTDEFWLLEAAMGIVVQKCPAVGAPKGHTMHCPTVAQLTLWKANPQHNEGSALATKIAEFWGDRYFKVPEFISPSA
jgi:hypothetical protein